VAKRPIYAEKAKRLLTGKRLDGKLIQEAAEIASQEAKPIDDVRGSARYRRRMIAVLVKRALELSITRCET